MENEEKYITIKEKMQQQGIHKKQLPIDDQIELIVKEALDKANEQHKYIYWVDINQRFVNENSNKKYINLRKKQDWEKLFTPIKKQNKPVFSGIQSMNCYRSGIVLYKHEPGKCDCEQIFKKYSSQIEKLQEQKNKQNQEQKQ
ncbi:hypothetical protein PPERSA_11864 [Pseudocohnilembus persalinus]|uniref:Uncharacterized protein n=1 Tax=Pseudocohnilembus persalinus TaxID=266149 RepID=A0A0V0QK78_PSEPJ|nr:hypothetical protein PPERSA_11864 [Pseudocohnilembus persalinus]|eukprot:KRX02524.1 hypothetical protein PPERSA_11864 [Pseudocohnilembus persalinus]